MCGIIGASGHFEHDSFLQVAGLISHRGPDDSGIFYDADESIGLGHSRLSIQDPSPLGHQPMFSDDGLVVLVFNGEIYNFRDLRDKLKGRGISFRGNSDTEVLINMYLADGVEMLSKLNGIFSFALWDARRQSLLLARDGLGVKPLYYAALGDRFVFCSEIKALGQLLPKDCALDNVALYRYLTFLWCPGVKTPNKAVTVLAPGAAMEVKSGQITRHWNWFRLPVFGRNAVNFRAKDVVDVTITHLRDAVQRQMVSDVPIGAFLSGGLDSSAVVAFASEINPDIACFTIETTGGQENGMEDDLPYARKVAKYLSVPLHVVNIDSIQMASDLERMVVMLDEPLADPAALNVFYISQLARKQGIKVLLSGAGGDDLFTGYRRHHAIQLDRWLSLIPRSVRLVVEDFTSTLNTINPFYRRLAKLFNGSSLESDERIINYFKWADRATLLNLFTAEVRSELEGIDPAEPMFEFLKPLSADVLQLDRMLALEQRFFLSDHNLTYTDKMSMAAGVEVRVPFLDLDLVEFAAKIPIKYKQRGSVGKWVLKKAMELYLPHDVIYRPKTGFGAPVRHWMRYELRELLGDLLSEDSLTKRRIFDPRAVQELIKRNDAGVVDASYTLLSLMCIEIWCRQFVDGQFNYKKVYGSTQ